MTDWKRASGSGLAKSVRWVAEGDDQKSIFVGDKVEGIYKQRKDDVGANGATVYVVETKEHGLLSVWDTAVLRDLFEEIPVGSIVQILHTGTRKPKSGGGKPYHTFEVNYAPAPMVKAGAKTEEDNELPPM